jgi:cell wall-associated NlpC family hydrolase
MGRGETRDVSSHRGTRGVLERFVVPPARPRGIGRRRIGRSSGIKHSLLAIIATTAAILLAPVPAAADPELPSTASEAVKQLAELNKQAEQLTEEYHLARDQLAARRDELGKAQGDFTSAKDAVEQARKKEAEFRGQVDKLATASFQGVRFNQLSALLVSDSPQDFLDQMAALELLAADNKRALEALAAAVAEAEAAERNATDATARAQAAEQQAAQLEADLKRRKAELEKRQAEVQRRYNQLTAADRTTLRSRGTTTFTAPPPTPAASGGSGVAVQAMRIALQQVGKPYQWSSEGPNSFDCSGLVYYSYQRVGITLPRSSQSMASVGAAVPRSAIQPGDLLFFYSPIHHVGISVGGTQMVHSPQTGDVVKVADWTRMPLTAVRRISG